VGPRSRLLDVRCVPVSSALIQREIGRAPTMGLLLATVGTLNMAFNGRPRSRLAKIGRNHFHPT